MTCHATADPVAAFDRFEAAYLDQRYSSNPAPTEVSAASRRILAALLGDSGTHEVLAHPVLRLAVVTARSLHLAASETGWVQGLGLAAASIANAAHRRALGAFYRRVLFADPRDRETWAVFPQIERHAQALTAENLAAVAPGSGASLKNHW